jgi:hypothetical protein
VAVEALGTLEHQELQVDQELLLHAILALRKKQSVEL